MDATEGVVEGEGVELPPTPILEFLTTKAFNFVHRCSQGSQKVVLAGQAIPFLICAYLWIAFHGAFILLGARLFRVDVHMTAIASVACIGGAASAPVVAAYHRKELVPVAIVLALVGYALGNYLGLLAAYGCRLML